MKNDPFKREQWTGSYASFIKSQIDSLEVGNSTPIDIGGNKLTAFRSTIAHLSADMQVKFKTKVNSDGDLWIKRVR